MLGVLLDNNTG